MEDTEELATELAVHLNLTPADRDFLCRELLRFGALSYKGGWDAACKILAEPKTNAPAKLVDEGA